MTYSCDDFEEVVALSEGSLEEVGYATLLYSLARARFDGRLAIARPPIQKEIRFEAGAPVEARSNLVTETLSRFMVKIGLLDEATGDACFQESCSRGVRFGDIVIEKGIVTAEKLLKVLQQNLAHKLLDGFSWKSGQFSIEAGEAGSDSSLKVNVAQLIVIGVTRFASQEQIDASIGPLIGKKLTVHPGPFFGLDDIMFSPSHQPVINALKEAPARIDELAASSGIAYEDLARLLHALTLVGLIIDSEVGASPSRPRAPQRQAMVPGEKLAISTTPVLETRDEVMQLVLNHRRMSPHEILGVEPGATPASVTDAFLKFAERCAPWNEDGGLGETTRELFLAGARAYAELQRPSGRPAPAAPPTDTADVQIKPTRPTVASPKAAAETFRISTDLLDPEEQFRKGKKLMAAGSYKQAISQLEYAFDLDSQNMTYRAELTYCRFLLEPATGSDKALRELKDVVRIDPRCAIAIFYTGEVLRNVGRLDEAEHFLKQAIKPMAPDRRPIDALRELTAAKKVKK